LWGAVGEDGLPEAPVFGRATDPLPADLAAIRAAADVPAVHPGLAATVALAAAVGVVSAAVVEAVSAAAAGAVSAAAAGVVSAVAAGVVSAEDAVKSKQVPTSELEVGTLCYLFSSFFQLPRR